MKKTLLYLSILMLTPILSSQAQVNFEEFNSFESILSKAKKEKKLVFVQVASPECNQCNDVAQKGLSEPALKEKYAVNFIAVFVKHDTQLYKEIMAKTDLKEFAMGSLFIDDEGYLLMKISSTTSSALPYINYADQAIKLSKNNILKELEGQYKSGKKDKTLLTKLIQEKNKIGNDTHKLTEEFIDLNTIDELSTIENARLLIEQGLPLESKGRKLLYAVFTTKMIDSLFFTHSLNERIKINNRVISSTRNIAVKTKNKNLAYQLSAFISRTYDNNWERGNFHSQSFMVNFYKDIRDTTNFLQTAESFCNHSLMSMSIDTMKKRDNRERAALFEQRRKSSGVNGTSSFSYSPFYQQYGSELNNIAYGVFNYTNDLEKLAKALKWSKRAIDIFEALSPDENHTQNPSFIDTYACLLYRLGKKEEATEWQTKAINFAKQYGEVTSNLEITLSKIKSGTL
jgi:hypothetical protein